MKGLPSWFIPLWCTVMPVTSLLLVPSIQGTIPPYMLAFASTIFVFLSRDEGEASLQRSGYMRVGLIVCGIWFFLLCGSQLGHLFSDRHDFGEMFLIDSDDTTVVLRRALFTQSSYLAACLCIALFFRFFFREEWMRYVLWGGWFLAIYGIYEWIFFLIFKQPGDFIVNRKYGEHTGSWSQVVQMGSLSLLRIKSTFGEPSWFSAGVIPYIFLALQYRRRWLCAALFFCIIFSTSTSAFAALPFALLLQSIFQRKLSVPIAIVIVFFAAAFATLYFVFPETYYGMFTAKISAENDSGLSRQASGAAMRETVETFTFMNQLFGIGFGYYYGGVFYAVLVNTGWIGMIIYCYVFLKPVIMLRPDAKGIALKVGMATLFFLFKLSVSELFLPTTWMFLGLAYWRLDRQRKESEETQLADADGLVPIG